MHTATAYGNFPHGTNPSLSNSVTAAPATKVNVPHIDVSILCDPVFGDPSSPDCFLSGSPTQDAGRVNCNVMGLIYNSSIMPSTFSGWGIELVKNLSGPVGRNCYTSGPFGFFNICTYTTAPNCSNLYPQYPITTVYDSSPAKAGWYIAYKCWGNSAVHACTALPALKTSNPGPWAGCVNPY
jgi:hypothetical protein